MRQGVKKRATCRGRPVSTSDVGERERGRDTGRTLLPPPPYPPPPMPPPGGPPPPPPPPWLFFWLAQLTLMALLPRYSPFIELMACSASVRSRKARNPYPRDLPVFMSHMTRASERDPNAEKAFWRTESVTSGERSPQKRWKWLVRSSFCALVFW